MFTKTLTIAAFAMLPAGFAMAESHSGGDDMAMEITGDAEAGERVFRKCQACHAVGEDARNKVGPQLNGVVGREVAAIGGFAYSGALVEQADVWTPENLDGFIADPRGWAPGTKMGFAGLRSPEDRANLIAYLGTTDG